MPVTQALNSKANVKKFTNQDLPFNPAQPVMSSYYATSTANQTVINLSFSVNQTLTDQFFLFVDGKKLRLGAGNDYIFTSIGADNTSSQVTLSFSLTANLNIQAFQLGLKNEVEFQTDNRFTQLYDNQSAGFQSFVDTTSFVRTATTNTGTPGTGLFHSNIVGRSPMVDLSQDLRARMGTTRVMTQILSALNNESGPNGEQIWSTPNDLFGQIRFGGTWSAFGNTSSGQGVSTVTTGDFVEIVFYGTGLNCLTFAFAATRGGSITVDGVAAGNFVESTASTSGVIASLNYSTNVVLPVVSGLALGIHTVRITCTSTMDVFGFEIINDGMVRVSPGIGYVQGKKFSSASESAFASNVVATGTRGGRTVVYQTGTGAIAQAFQATNPAQANLTAADHSNEEVIRTYGFREFGAATPSTDLSGGTNNANNGARAFTLEDGTTFFSTSSFYPVNLPANQPEGAGINTTNDFIIFTFVGTGLDVYQQQTVSSLTSNGTIQIDGTTIVTAADNTIWKQGITKIVSGLPYGTHTFYYSKATAGSGAAFSRFIVYGPKKPTVPSGAVEIADYYNMANYSFQATSTSPNLVSQGAIYKQASREFSYTGANWSNTLDSSGYGGKRLITTGNGQTVSYTFFGTGIEHFHWATLNEGVKSYTIDGLLVTAANFPSATVQTTTGLTYNNANGQVSGTPNTTGSKVSISGLTLGIHTITITKISGSQLEIEALGIITPVHSVKSQVPFDFNNSLPMGNTSIGDTRNFTPIKDASAARKNVSQAVGVVSSPSTSSTSMVPIPDMSVTHTNKTGRIKISYSLSATSSTNGAFFQIFVDGFAVGSLKQNAATVTSNVSDTLFLSVSPGAHKIDVYWQATGTATTAASNQRNLTVEEI